MGSRRNPWLVFGFALVLLLGLAACARQQADDNAISAAIKASYFSDPQVKNEQIEITVKNGEVTLTGKVSSEAAHLQAYKLAAATAGVKNVNDSLVVDTALGTPAPSEAPVTAQPTAEAVAAGGKPAAPAQPAEPQIAAQQLPPSPAQTAPPQPSAPTGRPSEAAPPAPAPAPKPRLVTLAAGTEIRIQMIDSVNSKEHRVGQSFAASLTAPIVVGDEALIPKGTPVFVKLTEVKSAGRIKGKSELELVLDRMVFQGKTYDLSSSTYSEAGSSRGTQSATRIGIGAGIGTAIGAIAGGGKGAAIGAAVGAGSATALQVFTRGEQVQVPSETKLDFKLQQPVVITLAPAKKQ